MSPSDVLELVKALCDGDDNAFHTLLEADDLILPMLMQHSTADAVGPNRAKIVEVSRRTMNG